MEFCSGQQDFGINFTSTAVPASSPDSVYNSNKPINIHQPPSPFYQQPHSPENQNFCKSQIILRPASPFPHTPSPTIQPSSPSELPSYSKSSSPNEPSYSKSSSPVTCPSQGEPQHLLDPCERSEPFIKSSSPPEPSYVYSKSLEPVSQFQSHLDPCQTSLAYPHYLQEGAESCLHYQVGTTLCFDQSISWEKICPKKNGATGHQLMSDFPSAAPCFPQC